MGKNRTQSILWNASLKGVNVQEVGGKGWNLFRLSSAGFPVPSWCIVSSEVFKEVIEFHKKIITTLLLEATYSSPDSIVVTSKKIGMLIASSPIASALSGEINEVMAQLFGQTRFVSVRSSVVGEDSKDHSFAGLMDSYLYVPRDQVLPALRNVWISAFSPRALLYRQRKRISLSDISTAVIIQQMVDAVSSGVLFTSDPETNDRHCVMTAGYGLGEGVVANLVDTDTYRVPYDGDGIRKEIATKETRVVHDESRGWGTRIEAVPRDVRVQPVLNDRQVLLLRQTAIQAEKRFGLPQDIEWAFDKNEKLLILQARPIVFAASISPSVRVWENSNIVESYPGITLPLTFSFVREGYECSFRRAASGFFPFRHLPKSADAIFGSMIGLLHGRIYYNLLNWYEMLSYLPGFKQHKDSWDQMIGIVKRIEFPRQKLSAPLRMFSLVVAAAKLLTLRSNAKRFFVRFRRFYRRFGRMDFSRRSEEELVRAYEAMRSELNEMWYRTLYNDFAAMKYYDWLKALCRRLSGADDVNLHNTLLCGERGVESVEPVRSLVRLAEMICANPEFAQLFDQDTDNRIWQRIQGDPTFEPLRVAVNQHLENYGDRGIEELKLERTTFRDDPAMLIGLVKNYYRSGLSVETMHGQEQSMRNAAEKAAKRSLRNLADRLLFWFVLGKARRAIANRENMRFARTRMFGIMRRLFRHMGEQLAEKGVFHSAVDIYFLTVEEVFAFVRGGAVTMHLQSLVDIRRGEYDRFATEHPGERLETTGIPYLNRLSISARDPKTEQELTGIGCSAGIVEGKSAVVVNPQAASDTTGKILIAQSTDPGWVFLMILSKGIVVEKGSVLSHTAIIGRELGIPTIVGVKDATRQIPNGATVRLDAAKGVVRWQ